MHENIVKQHISRYSTTFFFFYFFIFYSFLFSSFFYFFFSLLFSLLIDEMAFLPCVEVIPEHTERAARIKQSRVKK